MAQVTIRINGFAYPLACEDGQEQHMQSMAAEVDRQMAPIKEGGTPGGEARMLVMAALLLADKLHDTQLELDELRKTSARTSTKLDAAAQRKLSALAKRAEDIAATLEQS